MTSQKTCPTHHLELSFKPEGISKKGNRYPAFYACPNRDCKYTENIEEKQGHFLSMQAEFRRAKEIAFFNSVNAAVELTKEIVKGNNVMDNFTLIKTWRDFFYAEWSEFYKREILEQE